MAICAMATVAPGCAGRAACKATTQREGVSTQGVRNEPLLAGL